MTCEERLESLWVVAQCECSGHVGKDATDASVQWLLFFNEA